MTTIKPDQNNANRGTKRGKELLGRSLKELGAGRSILLDKDGNIIAGNKTFEQAQEAGMQVRVVKAERGELIAVQREDLDLDDPTGEARRLAYMDNRVAELDLEWDPDVLAATIGAGIDLENMGFNPDEILFIVGENDKEEINAKPKIDKADELCKKWKVESGQIWKLGEHRLLCGDSTIGSDVTKLLGDLKFGLLCTDPPYGINVHGGEGGEMTIANDDPDDVALVLPASLQQAVIRAEKKASFYIAGPHGPQFYQFIKAAMEAGLNWRQTIVWAKNMLVLGRSDYQQRHEVFLYGNFGRGRKWKGGRKQTSVFDESPQVVKFVSDRQLQISVDGQVYLVEGDNLTASQVEPDVVRVDKSQKNELHPTIKPLSLIRRFIRNSTDPGDVVYDPFCGSGTTILACENEKRICRAIEILPKYAAVSLERWLEATSSMPILEGI